MKTNDEMLKEICDVIEYDISDIYYKGYFQTLNVYGDDYDYINEREIIFSQNFMDKYRDGVFSTEEFSGETDTGKILNHLDNPTLYLYNTLGLGKQ